MGDFRKSIGLNTERKNNSLHGMKKIGLDERVQLAQESKEKRASMRGKQSKEQGLEMQLM